MIDGSLGRHTYIQTRKQNDDYTNHTGFKRPDYPSIRRLQPVLNQISPDERDKLFGRYGYVKRSALSKSISKNILQNISDLKRAEKGDL